jgi:ribosomal protein S27AE
LEGEIALFGSCPGTSHLRTPTLTIKKCPRCGEDVEIFSSDVKVKCGKCGLTVFNDMNLCIHWCAYAKECVGPELYEQLTKGDKEQTKSL